MEIFSGFVIRSDPECTSDDFLFAILFIILESCLYYNYIEMCGDIEYHESGIVKDGRKIRKLVIWLLTSPSIEIQLINEIQLRISLYDRIDYFRFELFKQDMCSWFMKLQRERRGNVRSLRKYIGRTLNTAETFQLCILYDAMIKDDKIHLW